MPLRVLIVDDDEAVRRGIRSLLAKDKDCVVCGEAADGLEATELARQTRPDIVLMDISMPHMGGIEATRIIRMEVPESEVIMVSQNDPALVSKQAAEVKARGYVSKATLSRDLIPAIQKIVRRRNTEGLVGQAPGTPELHDLGWLKGGAMGDLMRATDWSRTPLGPPHAWSPALRMMSKFLLANRFPQLLWWGPQFCCLYNDAYVPILGEKHPWALGQSVKEVWQEIWHVLKPLIETPYHGGPATWIEDIPLEINRRGFLEETHFTIAYSPVPDETVSSGIGGVLATVHEITDKVIGERRVILLRDLGARSVEPKSAEEACTIAAETLSHHPKDVPFVLLYLSDRNRQARFVCGAGVEVDDRACPKLIDISSKTPEETWPISEVVNTEEIQVVRDLTTKFEIVPQGSWSDPPQAAAIVPVRSNVAHQLAGFLIVGLSSRLQFDKKYRDFLDLMSTQIATSVANARAYEEERKRAEALAELDRAKTLFFSNVSHEFRTPLTLMLGPLEDALAVRDGLPPDQRERLNLVRRSSLRLLKLVNTLLDFSRIEAGRVQASYEPTDLPLLTVELASVFRSAIERAGMRFVIDCPPLPEMVYVDRGMWEKIVLNLLSNALKFTFEGEIAVSMRAVGSGMEMTVRDTGIGIPTHEIPRIFERFHRVRGAGGRSYEGSGIGLALVEELIRLHGGTIAVKSEVDRGTTFTVSIPFGKHHLPAERIGSPGSLASTDLLGDAFLEEALRWLPERSDEDADEVSSGLLPAWKSNRAHAAGPPIQSSASTLGAVSFAKPASAGARVLVVDDNADMREYLRRLLNNYDVEIVGDGEAAVEAAFNNPPDLVVTDVMMPKLDGFDVLRKLRSDERTATTPVILLSARAGEESRVEGLAAGADDYVTKPFSARELTTRVETHLKLSRFRQETAARERMLRREAERNELRFRAVIDTTPECVKLVSQDGTLHDINKAGLAMVQAECAEAILGKSLYDLIAPEDRQRFQEFNERVCCGEIGSLEFDMVGLQGSRRHMETHAAPLPQADGTFLQLAVTRDVTDRAVASRVTGLLAAVVDSSDDAIISKDLNGIVTSWNKGAERMFGYLAEEAIGQHITLIIPTDRREEETEILARLRRGERIDHFETVRKRKDGALVDISVTISPVKDAAGHVIGASKVARDITARKRADDALRLSENRLSAEARALAALNDCSSRLWRIETFEEGLEEMLTGVSELLGSDRASVQIYNPERRVLSICAQRGFNDDFLEFFREVSQDNDCAYGRPLRTGRIIVIEDIETDEPCAPHRAVARAAGCRAVVSAPMFASHGELLGVLSAHFASVHRPTNHELKCLELYVRHATDFIQRCRTEKVLRQSEERFRGLSERLDLEVRARTRELEERNADMQKQSAQLRELSWQLLHTQDEERRYIARELHDSASQTLAVLAMNLASLVETAKPESPEISQSAEEAQELVQQLTKDIRTTSYLLHPPLLDENGLPAALSWYISGLADRSKLDITFKISEEFGRLPREMELVVFRVVQECLTNIHRHSGSKTASIQVSRESERVLVEVRDQGGGISREKLAEIQSKSSGVGIRGMRERLRQFQGEIIIDSTSTGTTVLVTIPITKDGLAIPQTANQAFVSHANSDR
jgi:PAS domain S-box-containing protein